MDENSSFEPRLESLRGIAALYVAIHHGLSAFAGGPYREFPFPLARIVQFVTEDMSNPDMAVLFFFVLSGYVLGQSIERDPNYWRFIVRRTFRILPAFIVSVLFAYACIVFVRLDPAPDGLSGFFKGIFWPAPTTQALVDNLTFKGSPVNGPTWSIPWEIVGSVLLPVFVYAHRCASRPMQLPLFIVGSAFVLFAHTRAYMLPITEYFYAGFFLPTIMARYAPKHWIVQATMFAIGYLLLLEFGPTNQSASPTIAAGSIGGSLMIGAILMSKEFMDWLRHPALRFLGRVSYSFYLFHWPLFYLTAISAVLLKSPGGTAGNWIVCFVSTAIALFLSAVSYRWIELPAVSLGRRMTTIRNDIRKPQSAS